MAQPQNKQEFIAASAEAYKLLMETVDSCAPEVLERDFEPLAPNAKCCTFEQGGNLRDLLVHAYEWQHLQVDFCRNIRQGTPRDFIPEPYRKNYKEMDQANWQKHQSTTVQQALTLLRDSHAEIMALLDTFTDEELFGKKVFKVTYTTTMAAYFQSVTLSPYSQILKRLKRHIKACKK